MGMRHTLKFYIRDFYVMCKGLSGKLSCMWTGPEVIKKISCSAELSMKFFLLINVKMPIVVDILTFMSRKNSILGLYGPEKY